MYMHLYIVHVHLLYVHSSHSPLLAGQDHLAALMEVNEENETLVKQYDREKQKRKEIEEVRREYSTGYGDRR